MNRIMRIIGSFLFFGIFLHIASAETFELASPDKRIQVKIDIGNQIRYSIFHDSRELVSPSTISMTGNGSVVLGSNATVHKIERNTVNETLHPVVRQKSRTISDHYNILVIEFKEKFSLIFRAYDDGVAYRFTTRFKDNLTVVSEEAAFRFAEDHHVYIPRIKSFFTHQESQYEYLPLSEITQEQISYVPVLVDVSNGPKIAITEADLEDYPGMYLSGSKESPLQLAGKFPAYVLADSAKRDRDIVVTRRADFLAKTKGSRTFPWRVFIIAEKDGDLVESQMIYKLAKPLQLKETEWIRPGKVAWDWWNANNVYGVDFRAGINTETYKYYIDFAAEYGIEYIILDEGWYELGDLISVNPDIDMEALMAYGEEKGVGIILWVVWKTLDNQLKEALDQFEEWGVKGIKVDFMQREDQAVVNFYHKIAREAAERHMIVDFHGSFKPTGLRRAYPNVLTREGVRGMEWSKWSDGASPEMAVTLPFTRMLAGPMDYTPGAMINAVKEDFKPVFSRPMSQGTRCHQLAMYVVFESPLQMLADSPSNYLRETECMEFLSEVPTVWDETRVLDAKAADYILIARKHGEEWYVGAMTDWTPRELSLDFSFLDDGEYAIDVYEDGINADRCGDDYKKISKKVTRDETWTIRLAPGGGWAARIYQD